MAAREHRPSGLPLEGCTGADRPMDRWRTPSPVAFPDRLGDRLLPLFTPGASVQFSSSLIPT